MVETRKPKIVGRYRNRPRIAAALHPPEGRSLGALTGHSSLVVADLTYAKLTNANLSGADPTRTDLGSANSGSGPGTGARTLGAGGARTAQRHRGIR
ncbi:pentapeptide repeat-containing protein [Nocardia xishanensis]